MKRSFSAMLVVGLATITFGLAGRMQPARPFASTALKLRTQAESPGEQNRETR